MVGVFTYDGQEWSSKLAKITINGRTIARADFHALAIQAALNQLPEQPDDEPRVYIATGGGYGSNNDLIAWEKTNRKIPAHILSVKGEAFRNLEAFNAEKELVRAAIAKHFGAEVVRTNPGIVEETLRSFYSDEVNTKLAKAVVKVAFPNKQTGFKGKSVIHESASIYPDTIERATTAGFNGAETVLVAGDMDLDAALAKQKTATNRFNTAASYKLFSARFESELVPLFDKVRLYNTDDPKNPVLIAEKKGKGEKLNIIDPEKYQKFLEKKDIDLEPYTKDPAFQASTTSTELWDMIKKNFGLAAQPEEGSQAPMQKRAGGGGMRR